MRPEWRAYTASERAAIFQITYDEYRHLGLRRSGCIEVDAAERRCRTKARYNAKRRADRTAKRVSKSANDRAPLCPPETVGTVRVPSSAVVELVGSRRRDAEVTTIRTEGLHGEIEKTEIVESTARRSPPIRVTVQLRLSRKQRKRNGRNRGSSVSRAKSGCSRETRRAPAQRNAARRLVKNNRRNQLRWPGVVPVQGQVEKGARSARQSENWPRWPRNTQRPPCLPCRDRTGKLCRLGEGFSRHSHSRSGLREAAPGARTLHCSCRPSQGAAARNIGLGVSASRREVGGAGSRWHSACPFLGGKADIPNPRPDFR